jgi:ABC-type multidrug transport system fused ATPase/permease subunit
MFSNVSLSLAEAVVLLAAGFEVVQGHLTIGGLFAFMSAFWKLIGAANGVISQLPEISKLTANIQRLTEFAEGASQEASRDGLTRVSCHSIEADGVTVSYGDSTALKRIDLQIGQTEKVVIVGPNGSGKSTLAYVLTQLLRPTTGVVQAPSLERISALLTPFNFIPGSLRDNVGYYKLSEEKREQFWTLVEDLGLLDKVDQDPRLEFSEGEKKKAQIVMTLLKDADLYIFDEPLANLDSESKAIVLRRQLALADGKALISIMHGDEEYHSLFNRVIRLAKAS